MANIKDNIENIRQAKFGKEVRESLAVGLESVNDESTNTFKRQGEVEKNQEQLNKKFDEQIKNMTLADPSSAELVAARTNSNNGETYKTIGERLDTHSAQMEEIDGNLSLYQTKSDNELETTSKEIVSAINELFNRPSGENSGENSGGIIFDKWRNTTKSYILTKESTCTDYNASNYGQLRGEITGSSIKIRGVVTLSTLDPDYDTGGDKCISNVRSEMMPKYGVVDTTIVYKSDFLDSRELCILISNSRKNMLPPLRATTATIQSTGYRTFIPINLNYTIPYNWLCDWYTTFSTKINTVMNKMNVSSPYLICADTHFNKYSTCDELSPIQSFAINYLIENLNCDFGIILGDIITDHTDNTKSAYLDKIETFRNILIDNVLFVKGNHDKNNIYNQTEPTNVLTNSELFNKYVGSKSGISYNNNQFYYYRDDNISKIRHIILNSCDSDRYEENYDFGFTQKQLEWLCNDALQVPYGYHVALYSHHACIEETPSSDRYTINRDVLRGILKSFRDGTSVTLNTTTNPNNYPEFSCTITTNFKTQGIIIGYFFGHTHLDAMYKVEEINYINIKSVLAEERASVGIETTVMDIMQVDKNNRTVYLTRFGSGNDRTFTY